jgi:class 3 adenylate cyclase/tetratricopeptide (TPR) repeat protein
VTCSTCGAENPDGFRFCGSCGAELALERPPEREERKVVTVLFADLVGFTSQAERLDPEDVRAILGGYHARLRTELERHGGTVEKFIGDAVMALFGAPVAHEDDPERAVRAALAIRDALAEERAAGGRELHVRIGITTGEALVRLGARPETGEGMAAGDVVNTAARLQSAAPVDGVVVDEATWEATSRRISYREAEPVQAKGKAEPVPIWEALDAVASLGVDVARSARAPLVGREHELAVVREALARVRRDRSPQLVTLVGVRGIGKSRLVYELLEIADDDDEVIVWRQGRCLPYGEGGSFRALGDIVKAQAGILETDDDADAVAKLRAALEELLHGDGDAGWVERHLRPLAGLGGVRTDGGPEEAFAAWRRFVEALADEGPAVVVLEDVHWADELLLDFVEHLTDWAAQVPLLVVCVARPELLSRRPGWGGGKTNATTLSLAPLGDDEIARLVGLLLERSVMPAEVQSALLARAGGNPLYAEEFARLIGESGGSLDAAALPSSVQAIIAARLDGLDPVDKALLQNAAVIGKVFWAGAVASLAALDGREVERRLHELVRRQLVRPERRSSVASEAEYSFWHVVVREVAYGQIPRAERARKHRLAAEWIGSLAPDRAADRADLLAHHYLAAVEFARAAGQDTAALVGPAREALRAAGRRALELNAFAAAERSLRAAVELWPADDPARPRLLFEHAQAIFRGNDTGAEELEAARSALQASGDLEGAAEAETMLGEQAWMSGRPSETFRRIERATELVAELPESPGRAYVVANASRYLMLAGHSTRAIETGREAIAMAERLGLDEVKAHALNNIGAARGAQGDRGGLDDLEASIELAERIGSAEAIRGYINLAATYGGDGAIRRSHELHLRAFELAERFGQERGRRFVAGELAVDAYLLGDWDDSLARCDAFLAEVEAGAPHYMEGGVRLVRASINVARGETAGVGADLALGLEKARDAGEPQTLLPALAVIAAVAADQGDLAAAAAAVDELLGVLEDTEGGRVELWLYPTIFAFEALGRLESVRQFVDDRDESLWANAGRLSLAGDLVAAADLLEEAGDRVEESRTRLAAAERLVAAGRRVEADEQLALALAFYRSVGATLYVRRGERLLAASA